MYHPRLAVLLCSLLVSVAHGQLVAPPPAPELTDAGRALILEYEVGGRSGYNPHPEWPGFRSGVTQGIGYDNGYNARAVILGDWRAVPGVDRLAATAGISGPAAKPRAAAVRDIVVAWSVAEDVFERTTLSRFWQLTRRTYPGFDELRPNCQAALVSLIFNRGSDLVGPRRLEMRNIRHLVIRQDYPGIAREIRRMKRLWIGTDIETGMARRREAEAKLAEQPP